MKVFVLFKNLFYGIYCFPIIDLIKNLL